MAEEMPKKRRKRVISTNGVPVSFRMFPDLLDTLTTDAGERGVYTTTLLQHIVAAYYGNVDEQLRADCAREGEGIKATPTVEIGAQCSAVAAG